MPNQHIIAPTFVPMFIRHIIHFTTLLLLTHTRAQTTTDTTHTTPRSTFAQKWQLQPHSPLRATIYSAILPGAGQVYNHKTWKALIAVGGIGTCIAFIRHNNNKYNYYRQQYIAQNDGNPATPVTAPPGIDLYKTQENYHRLLDISYICLGATYILQVIDANVDGHLFYYDVSDDLSLTIHPSLAHTTNTHTTLGLTLRF